MKKENATNYYAAVVGGGSGGLTVARSLARVGKKVVLIEKHILGGDCTNYGCVPSKTLLAYMRAHSGATLQQGLAHMRAVRANFLGEENEERLRKEGIEVVLGTATYVGNRTLTVQSQTYQEVRAERIIFATGSTPVRIELAGVPKEKIITNEELFELRDNPRAICIVGGGYIGCEMAEALARAGVAVTVLQREARLVPREEPESSAVIHALLASRGVTIVYGADTASHDFASYEYVLLALGRTPRVPDGLREHGVEVKKGIVVDAYSQTSVRGVYALGDCVDGNPTFTHWANNEGRGLVRNFLVPFWRTSVRSETLPTVLYTEHEVARVGPTREQLLADMHNRVRTVIVPFSNNDRAKTDGDTAGFVMLHTTPILGRILGASIVGTHAGEMLPRLTAAVRNHERASTLSREVYAYPTRAEVLKKAADATLLDLLKNWRSEVRYVVHTYALRIVAALFWLGTVLYVTRALIAEGQTPLMLLESLFYFVNAVWYGPIIYAGVYAFRALFFFPATLLTVISGILFGPIFGPLYTWVGEVASSQVSYGVGRFFRGSTGAASSSTLLKTLEDRDPFTGVLLARLLFVPFDLFNYAAGAMRLQWRGYTLATMLGIIPGMLAFVLAGASLNPAHFFATGEFAVRTDILFGAIGICVASVLFAKVFRGRGTHV